MSQQKRQSFLGQARGSGSAKGGAHHWLLQRMTSVALVILGSWFFYGLATHDISSYQSIVAWLQNPFSFALMLLTLLVSFYHASLGLQVVIEDYIHHEGVKFLSLIFIKLTFAGLFLAAFYSLIKIQPIVMASNVTPGIFESF